MTLSATDGDTALDFADTLVRRLNLAAMLQDSSIEAAEKDYYGGLWDRYDALVGVANNSNTSDSSK